MSKWVQAAAGLVITLGVHGGALAASGDTVRTEAAKPPAAKAEENRRKPLRRCDQLADKAQLDCLQKARQRVVEARRKREASNAKGAASAVDKDKTIRPAPAPASTSQSK